MLDTANAVKADTSVVFELTTDLLADKAAVFTLTRHNHMKSAPASGRQGIVSVKATAGTYTSETAEFYDRLRISKLWWFARDVGHASSNGQALTSYPCDTTTISVTLRSSVELLGAYMQCVVYLAHCMRNSSACMQSACSLCASCVYVPVSYRTISSSSVLRCGRTS